MSTAEMRTKAVAWLDSNVQGKIELHRRSLLSTVEASIDALNFEQQLAWMEAPTWELDSPLSQSLAGQLGIDIMDFFKLSS